MAKKGGNPQNLKPQKKGEPSINPNGRPKLTEIERQAREITRQEHADITVLLHTKSKQEIEDILSDPDIPIVRAMRIRRVMKEFEDKNTYILTDLDNRNLGAPVQKIEAEVVNTDMHDRLKKIAEGE